MSLCLLASPAPGGACRTNGGNGGSGASMREGVAGDESSTIGSDPELPAPLGYILTPDLRRRGASAVVKRLLRSELRESVRGKGRLGSVPREADEVEEEGVDVRVPVWGAAAVAAESKVGEGSPD